MFNGLSDSIRPNEQRPFFRERDYLALFFRGVIGLDGACLDDDGGVTALVVLGLIGDGAGHVAGGHQYPG